jgi:hypothetical protein
MNRCGRFTSMSGLIALIALWLISLATCGRELALESNAPENLVPTGAAGIEVHDLGWGKQISFLVTRKYPQFAFGEEDLAQWAKRGFRPCKLTQGDWTSVVYKSYTPPTRKYLKQMLLFNGSRRILLIGEYRSTRADTLAIPYAGEPDSSSQVGTMMIYAESKELSEQITSALSADCSK